MPGLLFCPRTPPTQPTLPNFLENTLIPYAFRSVDGVGRVISERVRARSILFDPEALPKLLVNAVVPVGFGTPFESATFQLVPFT